MPNPQPLKLYSLSRVTTDWTCPRKRFWQYHWAGRGVVPATIGLELYLGSAIHDSLAGIARSYRDSLGLTIDDIAFTACEQVYTALLQPGNEDSHTFASEQSCLVEGLVRGLHKHIWPKLITRYPKVVFIEEEMEYEHDGLIFMSKPDLVLATEDMAEVVYVEWKSTSSKKEEWINSWNTAVQLHSTIKAVEASKGVKIDQVIIQGLYKGYKSYGRVNSPFTYGFRKGGQPPFTSTQWSYEWKSGWDRVPVWEMEGGSKAWIENMPETLLADQFPQTPPIMVKDDLVEAFFQQRAVRENEIAVCLDMLEACDEASQKLVLGACFPQRFDKCQEAWGRPCQYRILCHGGVEDPLTAGFEYKTPSPHQMKLEMEQQLAKISDQEEALI